MAIPHLSVAFFV